MTDAQFYRRTLYPFQDEVLRAISGLDVEFYLTGGTAASRGYLDHRFSDDLDFFVNDSPRFALWSDRVVQALGAMWRTTVLSREERFERLEVVGPKTTLKVELVNDVPAHVGEIKTHPVLGRLDSAENILANKLTALVDRQEPKDIADVWGFCCRLRLPLWAALDSAQSKAAGLFAPDVARILASATRNDWDLVRWTVPPDPDQFLSDVHGLAEMLVLGRDGR